MSSDTYRCADCGLSGLRDRFRDYHGYGLLCGRCLSLNVDLVAPRETEGR